MQKLVFGVAALIVVLLIIGLALPSQSRLIVTTEVDAPAATVFALVNDMRRRQLWSPISAQDPNARIEFSGPVRGPGASVSWDGPVVGSGTETIVNSQPFAYVESLINAGEPGEARHWFRLVPGTGVTEVERGFEHDYGWNLVGRYVGLLVTGVIRRDYDNGLASLKRTAESLPSADFSDLEIERLRVEPLQIAYVSTGAAPTPAAVSAALGAAYRQVLSYIDRQRLQVAGAPLAIKRSFSGAELRFDAGIPVSGVTDETPQNQAPVRLGLTHGGTVIRATHIGGYDRLAETHRKITAYLAALGIERSGDAWESYVSDPAEVEERDLVTYIYYPILEIP